jgi:hypothetical protein
MADKVHDGKVAISCTAAQIAEGELEPLGKRIIAHLERMRGYEALAQQKAGIELKKAENNWITVTQLLAEAKGKCDKGGFKAFQKKYCPDLGRSRIYELLAIGTGKRSLEDSRAAKRMRMARSRSKVSATTADVADKPSPKGQPRMNATEQGTFGAIRERAHDLGYRLRRKGRQFDLAIDGKTDPVANLVLAAHLLDIAEGKITVAVEDVCQGNPLSLKKELNGEAARAYATTRLPALVNELKKIATKVEHFADCEIEPDDLEAVSNFLRQVATEIRTRASVTTH